MLNVVYTGVAVFFWVVFLISFIRARSRYRNCYLLFFAFVSTIIALTFLAGEHQKQILIILMVVILLALLCVPVFLISNGVLMYEREGHSLKNLLSFIFGLVIGSPVALLMQNRECFQIATAGNWIISIVCLVIGFAVAWFMSTLDKKQSEPA